MAVRTGTGGFHQKSENRPTLVETGRRGRPKWNYAKLNQCFFFCGKILQKILAIGSCFPEKWKHHGE